MKNIKEHRKNIKNLEQESEKIRILQEIYRMNRNDTNKKNDNLTKIVADPDILLIAYEKIRKNLVGTPQGGIASPIIFNIYMQKFDEEVLKKINEIKEKLNSITFQK